MSPKLEPSVPGQIFFPQFPLPLNISSPAALGVNSTPFKLLLPTTFAENNFSSSSTGKNKNNPTNKKKEKIGEPQGEKQSFKCYKCGKTYNWNYNLNRHKRFECGIENKYQCSMCQKRFPYKQNVAIHLKRKHKLEIESAEDMIAGGHITLLPGMSSDN